MQKYVAKFGGTSLADAGQFKKVAEIIKQDPVRKYIVASAPGKRYEGDTKVTDLLYECYNRAVEGGDYLESLEKIRLRFQEIIDGLEVQLNIDNDINAIKRHIENGAQADYMASRGEYLSSKVLSAYLGFKFIDAADCIRFDKNGALDEDATAESIYSVLKKVDYAVIPGFYGSMPHGRIKTFTRGGSDITGALIASAIRADMYENWTDVPGMLAADPHVVDNPITIESITYRELRELAYMGASVMHESAVLPARQANIITNIKNTNDPSHPGTLISREHPRIPRKHKVAGIAGKKGFSAVLVETPSMNEQIGFGARLLTIFAKHNVSFEHLPTGIDTMSVVVHKDQFDAAKQEILNDIREQINPEYLFVEEGLAMIAVVGLGMAYSRGTAARIMRALADSRVNIKMIDQGSTEINIIIGVDEDDYETAIRSIYNAIYK